MYKHFLLLSFLFVFFSCKKEEKDIEINYQGNLLISLTDANNIQVRGLPSDLPIPLAESFDLVIQREANNETVYNGLFQSTPFNLQTGLYKLRASYGANKELDFDTPYYEGKESSINIKLNEVTNASIICKVSNALASVEYVNQNEFDKLFSSYGIEVKTANKTLNWDHGTNQNPYFKTGIPVNFIFKGIRKNNSQEYSFPIDNKTFNASENFKIKLTIEKFEGSKFNIKLNTSIDTVSINETIPQTWLPKPKVTSNGFGSDNTVTIVETEQINNLELILTAVKPIEDIKFELNFEDVNYSHLNNEYFLSELSTNQINDLLSAGIVFPELGKNSGVINLKNLANKLLTLTGGQTANNYFNFAVKANGRWSNEGNPLHSYNIKIEKPQFYTNVYPGDIWTKEFTISEVTEDKVTKGDFAKMSILGFTYEFSTDGLVWTTISGLKKSNLAPGTKYYARAVYRNEIPGEIVEFRTYEAQDIPNGNLDGTWNVNYPKSNNPLYTPSGWWDTRNPLTCHDKGLNVFYVSKSGTIPVNENGGKVAHLMTLGWGRGNTCTGKKSNSTINNISSGMLCVGSFNTSTRKVSGIETYTRPTSVEFVYKSAPFKDDKFQVSVLLENITGGDSTQIGIVEFESNETTSVYKTQVLNIEYDETKKMLPVTHMSIIFKSGILEDIDHLEDIFRDASFPFSNAYIIGSQLWIDSVKLNFDK